MHGSKTPEDVETEFRKHYIVTGNVAGSAKAVGIPVSTGYELRNRAHDDPAFVKARDAIRARLEPDAEQMAVAAMQLCLERLNNEPPDPEKLALLGIAKVSVQDAGPQYAASLAKLFQAVIGGRKYEAERDGVIKTPGSVNITVRPTAEAEARIEADDANGG